nr:hypothetical protein [Nonomuraea sp. WAC 01424]
MLADRCVQTAGEPVEGGAKTGQVDDAGDVVVVGVGGGVDDVVAQGAVEQRTVLFDQADAGAAGVPADLVGGDAVEQDDALVGVVEAAGQREDGGLARAGSADQGDVTALRDGLDRL